MWVARVLRRSDEYMRRRTCRVARPQTPRSCSGIISKIGGIRLAIGCGIHEPVVVRCVRIPSLPIVQRVDVFLRLLRMELAVCSQSGCEFIPNRICRASSADWILTLCPLVEVVHDVPELRISDFGRR